MSNSHELCAKLRIFYQKKEGKKVNFVILIFFGYQNLCYYGIFFYLCLLNISK